MAEWMLQKNMQIVRGPTNCETALSGVSALPASGSYIDVTGYEYVSCVVHLGTIDASDTPSFAVKCSDSTSGTLDSISSTLSTTPAVNDDGQLLVFEFPVEVLPTDHHFVALATSGTLTNGSYADALFFLHGARHCPVSISQMEAAHAKAWDGAND